MSQPKARVFVVEDEQDIRDLMILHLEREGYETVFSADGEDAAHKLFSERFDLLIFDWMLPVSSGLDLIKATRKANLVTPILMVTARAESADIILGLEAGADDYITKPFDFSVFMARVRALLRRGSNLAIKPQTERLQIGELSIDPQGYKTFCSNHEIQLTHSEFKLLAALAKNNGKVLTRTQLIDLVQGNDVTVTDRTIDTHVFGLRKKLGACGEVIETVRGVGYRVKVQ